MAFALGAAACASTGRGIPPGTTAPDKFLFDKGTAALDNKKWITAREYFREIVDTYTQSPYRPDAAPGAGSRAAAATRRGSR